MCAPCQKGSTASTTQCMTERKLKPIDRDVMLLYLEGVDGAGIAEVLGISVANVAQKVHRSKKLLQRRFDR
jgi:RNA polymerase sigma-70 factor (ECF subfamily)